MLPLRRSGRPRNEQITRAYRDWLAGMRGVELYERHIPNYRNLSHWEQRGRAGALDQTIRARRRREEKKRTPKKLIS